MLLQCILDSQLCSYPMHFQNAMFYFRSSHQSNNLHVPQIGRHVMNSGLQNDKMSTSQNLGASPRNVGMTTSSDTNEHQNTVSSSNQNHEITTDNNAALEDSFFFGGGHGEITNDRGGDSEDINITDVPSIVDNETVQQ